MVFMNSHWDLKAFMAGGCFLAQVTHNSGANFLNFSMSESLSRMTVTPCFFLKSSKALISAAWTKAYCSHECCATAASTICCRYLGRAFHLPMLIIKLIKSTG